MIGTAEYIYNRDVNGVYYINANLPAAQSAFVGADNRPRWTGTACAAPTAGPCVTRLNNAAGNQVTNAIVMKNQDVGRSWNFAASLMKTLQNGFSFKGAYSYGESSNTIDAGSIAAGSFTGNPQSGDPNNPGLGVLAQLAGTSLLHRRLVLEAVLQLRRDDGVGVLGGAHHRQRELHLLGRHERRHGERQRPDLHPARSVGDELRAVHRPAAARSPRPSRPRRGTPTSPRTAISASTAASTPSAARCSSRSSSASTSASARTSSASFGGARHSGQIRLDISNFGNLLNSNWGVGQRLVQNQILTNAAADAQGRATYRMAVVNGALPTSSYQSTSGIADVYTLMLSFRYNFN